MYESMVCTFILVLDYVLVKLFLCAYILFFIMYNKQHRTKDLSGRRNAAPAMQYENMGVLQHAHRSIIISCFSKWRSSPRHTVRIGTPD